MNDMFDLHGAIDLHMHPYPCLIPRIADDRAMAASAAQAGLRAILIKCHHESTVSRAYLVGHEFPQISVFGGIVLNHYVGGINPAAVEAALRLGGKEVWMPTTDAAFHAQMHGGRTGSYDVQTTGETRQALPGISVLKDGQLTPETLAVLDLMARHDAILGTAHLSKEEIRALVKAARERGLKKILITHPFFKVPNLDLPFLEELVPLGAMAEFGYCTVSPMWAYATIDRVKEAIGTLGPENCVLMSDAGQRHNPMPVEALRIFAQCLYERGVSKADLTKMIFDNPRRLLSIE